MSRIGVIGGGIAGCTVASELADAGEDVVLLEKEDELGGNIKNYGCKATDSCTKCNLCLVDSIFNSVRESDRIEVRENTAVLDCLEKEGFGLVVEDDDGEYTLDDISEIVLATGHKRWSELETGTPEIFEDERILWASDFEDMLEGRKDQLCEESLEMNLGFSPDSAVFLQCNGSRSIQEKARYCSKVCCGYNYRIAQVLRHNFPEMDLSMFFIDMQEAGFLVNLSFEKLSELDIDYYNCKPLRLESSSDSLQLNYEDQKEGKMEKLDTDLLVLSEGIHRGTEHEHWSKIFNLQQTEDGFLRPIWPGEETGVYLAGTVTGPGDSATTIAKSRETAYRLLDNKLVEKAN
ncbi:FAD-dependent oxidoreductase [Halarsenatibacter silvermanii]|uniref:Heterodisulfide reductase subunit A n=1 Tax=Halarsenatibacter silvermanii TaxID=321763 RepID=A0A1G9I4B1_9FIRM|nr:FAD-dependent oxidoreductase [Halarsenatibacter silvermanii]SDL20080.1 heterodisulfide reductase subunit A [Halarsenatibacter silvermanii]